MLNPCVDIRQNWINVPEITLEEEIYLINSETKIISGISDLFTVENKLCGSLILTVNVNETSIPVRFVNDTFEIFTSELHLSGTSQ